MTDKAISPLRRRLIEDMAIRRLGPKEHEMHHRAQLMLIERMLGITPHLTRQMEERIAAMQAAKA